MEVLGPKPNDRAYYSYDDSDFPGCHIWEVWRYDHELTDTDLAKYLCCFAEFLRVLEQPKNPNFPGPSQEMKEKLPYGKFLVPFSYDGPYVYVRLFDNSYFGGRAWKIYARWLDNAGQNLRSPSDPWAKMIFPRILNARVHHEDHMPFEYKGIPDASRMSEFLKISHKNSGWNIPPPYNRFENMAFEWADDLGIPVDINNVELDQNPYKLTF